MKYSLIAFFLLLLLGSCNNNKEVRTSTAFTNEDLLFTLEVLAHDSLEGRGFATVGNKKARAFLKKQFDSFAIEPAFSEGYDQLFDHTISKRRRQYLFPVVNPGKELENVPDTTLTGGNIVAKIPGKSEKIIVITAHHDHLGTWEGEIYNGADDDASGTAALLAIANHFKYNQPNHTLIIAAVDAEEIGSPGCKYLAANFPGGIDNVVLNVNMDMIAHNDMNEIWACGTYHYPNLKEPISNLDSELSLLFGHDDPNDSIQDDWTRSSDHRIFHDLQIPFIYFGVEDHQDYHEPSDTFNNINQAFYIDAVELIIQAIDEYDNYFSPIN